MQLKEWYWWDSILVHNLGDARFGCFEGFDHLSQPGPRLIQLLGVACGITHDLLFEPATIALADDPLVSNF